MKKTTIKRIKRFMKENHLDIVALVEYAVDDITCGSLIQRLPDGAIRWAPVWCHDTIRRLAGLPKRRLIWRDTRSCVWKDTNIFDECAVENGTLIRKKSGTHSRRRTGDPKGIDSRSIVHLETKTQVFHHLDRNEINFIAVSLGLATAYPDGTVEFCEEFEIPG